MVTRARVAALLAAAVCAVALPAAATASASANAPGVALTTVARVGFGGGHSFGRSPGFGSRSRGFGSNRYYYGRRRHGIARRIFRALAIGYLLHLLFTTPGGLIVLLFMIVLVAMFVRRTRRVLRY